MTLTLSRNHRDAILAHAQAESPRECCGLLAGLVEHDRAIVREVHPVLNVSKADPTASFLLDPEAHLRLQRDCRGRGLDVIGFYHSHPKGSAFPSAFDLELAWPRTSYVIVALRAEGPPELRSWRLDAETKQFHEESVEITD